jgi:leucyl aminopeptidase
VPRVTFFGIDVDVVVGSENSTPQAREAQTLIVTDEALARPAWADAARALELVPSFAEPCAEATHAGEALSEPRSRARAVVEGRATDVFRVRALPKKNLGLEEATRKAVGAAVADWKTQGVKAARLILATGNSRSNGTPGSADSLLKATLESLAFALYRFEYTFGNAPIKRHERALSKVTVEVRWEEPRTDASGVSLAFGKGETLDAWVRQEASIALAWQFARWLGDRPANTLSPAALVEEVAARVTPLGVSARILDEKSLEAQGFGGILAVGKGSANPPRLGIYEYAPVGFENAAPIVLVGKGVTFDTGGYSIKPKQHHNDMKYDMCGAAGVAAALEAIARAKLPVRVVALLACAENMVSRDAQRPGDVYRAWNGKTVDVYNTDAEGRLLLGDALAFSGTFAPSVVVDMATLTGGTLAIAGNLAAIACASHESLVREIREAGASVGEKYLHLEILPEVIADMKGLVSDYTNMNAKWSTSAMTMHAAAFLGEFVPEGVDWLHLDIAGMAYAARDNGYAGGPGANAYGARSLFHFVANRALRAH